MPRVTCSSSTTRAQNHSLAGTATAGADPRPRMLLLIPLLVGLYLWLVQHKRDRSMQVSKTMFDLVIPRDRTWLRHVAVGLSILTC